MIWFALFDDEKILGIIITICLIISLLCAKGTASFYAKQYNGKGQEKTKKIVMSGRQKTGTLMDKKLTNIDLFPVDSRQLPTC